MVSYDIKNRNGSLVFVRGVRVKPYSNFSADLDPLTARELVRYGVSLTAKKSGQQASAPVVASAIAPEPQPVAALAVEATVAEPVEEAAPEEPAESLMEEAPVAETASEEVETEEVETAEVETEEVETAEATEDSESSTSEEPTPGSAEEDFGRRRKKNRR